MAEHSWVHHVPYEGIPPYAVVGGHDCDNAPIYVGRSLHEGDQLPAKVVPSKNTAYVCWGGAEHTKNHYDILVGQHYGWVPCFSGRIPPNAVRAGNTSTGEPLYIGRGHWDGSLTVGKIHSSHGCLYIPFGGQEHRLDSYEVLISNFHSAAAPIYPSPLLQSEIIGPGSSHHDYKWIHSSLNSGIPPNAVIGGNDCDGSAIYVGRAFHNGDMLCAKVIPSKNAAYVCWRGQEIIKDHFEMLCGSNLIWKHCPDHIIPDNAVLCGRTSDNQPSYIGRGHYESSFTVGKVLPAHRALFIPYGGCERRIENYEILVEDRRDPGWAMSHPPPMIAICPPAPYPSAPILPLPQHGHVHPSPTWVSCSPNYTPFNAVHAGHDADMTPIFVGRALHEKDMLPAKVLLSRNCAYISFAGHEVKKYQYEVLVGDGYQWVHAQNGYVPPGAVQVGQTSSGEPLYIGRAPYCGSLTPGKLQRSHQCLYIPFGGLERRISHYEVLVSRGDYNHLGIKTQHF